MDNIEPSMAKNPPIISTINLSILVVVSFSTTFFAEYLFAIHEIVISYILPMVATVVFA